MQPPYPYSTNCSLEGLQERKGALVKGKTGRIDGYAAQFLGEWGLVELQPGPKSEH